MLVVTDVHFGTLQCPANWGCLVTITLEKASASFYISIQVSHFWEIWSWIRKARGQGAWKPLWNREKFWPPAALEIERKGLRD